MGISGPQKGLYVRQNLKCFAKFDSFQIPTARTILRCLYLSYVKKHVHFKMFSENDEKCEMYMTIIYYFQSCIDYFIFR